MLSAHFISGLKFNIKKELSGDLEALLVKARLEEAKIRLTVPVRGKQVEDQRQRRVVRVRTQ